MTALARLLPRFLVVGAFLIALGGCVVGEGGYYGYYGAPGYDLDYYGYGYDYGVWGPGYSVGPFFGARRFDHDRDRFSRGGSPGSRGFRGAPVSRLVPGIPSAPRGGGGPPGGGGRGGGGRGGGGHGGGGHGGGGGRNH